MGRSTLSMSIGVCAMVLISQAVRGESTRYSVPAGLSGSAGAIEFGSATALRSVPSFIQRVPVPLLPDGDAGGYAKVTFGAGPYVHVDVKGVRGAVGDLTYARKA